MKRALLCILLSLSLVLTGCAALLEREYADITQHSNNLTAEGDPSVLRAESYQELVNALVFFITQGAENGSIRLYRSADTVKEELEAACLEVIQEDPLGAYCVEHIKYDLDSVVTYFEADVQITYRRTREQVSAIQTATGATAIRSELEDALSVFAPECVLRISHFDGDEDYILDLFRNAYYAVPVSALGKPEVSISIYPENGRQRIVELLLSYPLETEELADHQARLHQAAENLALPLLGLENDAQLSGLFGTLSGLARFDPDGGSTAHHALAEGSADSEGLALAAALLCQELDIGCHVARGEKNGVPHFWLVADTDTGWRHLDPSLDEGADVRFRSDREMAALGYTWDREALPSCGPSEEASPAVPAP